MAIDKRAWVKRIGLVAGPLLGALVYWALPEQYGAPDALVPLTHAARVSAAVGVWMALWWLTEAIHVSATALVPLVALPLLGARALPQVSASYGHPLIFMFMGGFMLSMAMQRWNLHQRIALLTLRFVGAKPGSIVAGCMGVSALLSMWVSNTATAVMLMPVAASIIGLVDPRVERGEIRADQMDINGRNFATCLLLGVAYSASIGGMGTLIGTPPNLFLASYMRDAHGLEISFVRWMMVGVPLVLVMLPLTWWLLTRWLYPITLKELPGGRAYLSEAYAALGATSRGERATMVIFGLAVVLWLTRPLLNDLQIGGSTPLAGLDDANIAMLAALLLLVWPLDMRAHEFVLDWESAERLPWGILILFGGGLALSSALEQTGVSAYLGAQLSVLEPLPGVLLVLALTTVVIFLTELTSNIATTATLVPLAAALAIAIGMHPLALAAPVAIAASCAFMLPVATPPNAVVFGTGMLKMSTMLSAGFWLNVASVVLVTLITYALVLPLLVP